MNIFEQMIKVMQTEMPEPSLFGGAHIFWLVLTVIGIITISLTCKNISDKKVAKYFHTKEKFIIFMRFLPHEGSD